MATAICLERYVNRKSCLKPGLERWTMVRAILVLVITAMLLYDAYAALVAIQAGFIGAIYADR